MTERGAYVHTVASMGTVVTIHVVGHEADRAEQAERKRGVECALAWFHEIERVCSRFDPSSEVSQLSAHVGARVRVSDMLFEAVRFALAVAEESDGAFDPTVGLLLDLGAVAKGLAIDMAARELRATSFDDFAIDAGGDLYLAGCNADGKPWSVGVRNPRDESELYETLLISNASVCTSGDYARRVASDAGHEKHHIIDPRTRVSASVAASVTVLAPSAMVADALSTAAFVLGPADGLALLERHGVDGLVITPELERFATRGMSAHSHVDARSSPDFARDR